MASPTTNVDESIKHITTHVEDKLGGDSLDDAKNASDAEHSATFWQAISANRQSRALVRRHLHVHRDGKATTRS